MERSTHPMAPLLVARATEDSLSLPGDHFVQRAHTSLHQFFPLAFSDRSSFRSEFQEQLIMKAQNAEILSFGLEQTDLTR